MTPHTTHARSSLPVFLLLALTACGGSGGGGGTVTPGGPPGPLPSGPGVTVHSGLLAAAAGSGEVRVEYDLPESSFEAALFHSANSTTILATTPITPLSGSARTITGLTNGQQRFFVLGIRPPGSSVWTQAGEILRATPNPPIYVDAGAGGGGNGSLAAPFQSLAAAAAAAPVTGANIWVRAGTYTGPVSAKAGTQVFGGFAAGAAFTLDNRNAQSGVTIVTTSGLAALDASLPNPSARIVFDGIVCRGNGTGFYGVDTEHADLDLRSLTITGFADRGIRMRHLGLGTAPPTEIANAQIVNCTVQQSGADGLSLIGAYNLRIDGCKFDANVQEGIHLSPLYGINGFTTTFHVTASRFANNGSEGIEAVLAQPVNVTAGSATFDVSITGCRFDGNQLAGLLVDQDHELAPGWTSHVVIRECTATDNGQAGVHVDADGPGQFLLHRIRSIANGGDGILVTSEQAGGPVDVSASYLAGNLGAGLNTSLGNKRLLASHCVFAGNQLGGFLCNAAVPGSAANCVAHLQPTPFQNVRVVGSPTVTDAGAAAFVYAPTSYAKVLSNTTGTLVLAAAAGFATGATVELADDDTARNAAQVSGTTVVLSSAPTLRRLPTALLAYPGSTVAEDIRLAAGSVMAGLGMKEAGAPNVDPGPFGAPVGGQPGTADPLPQALVWLDQVTPTPPGALGSSQVVSLHFSQAIAAASVTPTRVRVLDAGGNVVAAGVLTSGSTITLNPPGGGWPAGALRVELHRGITATDLTPLQPLNVPLR